MQREVGVGQSLIMSTLKDKTNSAVLLRQICSVFIVLELTNDE